MRKIVEFMLSRMATHPEEFYEERKSGVAHNWLHHIKTCKKFMTEEEYKAVWDKVSEINLEYTMERITEKLFEPEKKGFDEDDLVDALKHSYVTQGKSMPDKMVLSRTQVEMLKTQMEHQRELMKIELEACRLRER
jgi:hypothetical protein